jgi:hypothetical protein
MVAYAEPKSERMRPIDTGAIFGEDVRIWMVTNDPGEARNLGAQLQKMGLPIRIQLIQKPTCTGVALPMSTATGRNFILILETVDGNNATRFMNWLKAKQAEAASRKKEPPATLNDLADSGEIEVFDAG